MSIDGPIMVWVSSTNYQLVTITHFTPLLCQKQSLWVFRLDFVHVLVQNCSWNTSVFQIWTRNEERCTVRAPVFGRHQFFGTSEHYGKAHGSLLSGWMNDNYTACCWFPTSNNILILPSHFWQIKFESAEYWCFYGILSPSENRDLTNPQPHCSEVTAVSGRICNLHTCSCLCLIWLEESGVLVCALDS